VPILTTTTTTDPYAPPPVIDAAYVNRVLAGLDQVVGEAVRMALEHRAVTPQVEEYLRAAYADEGDAFVAHRERLQNDAERASDNIREPPGRQATTVSRLISIRADCIFAEVHRDFSAVVIKPNPELAVQWIGLKPLDRRRDPADVNPTPWMYVYDGFPRSHTQPSDPCAST
jgi:hypothetical protein